uniref:Dimer_Tnp_hAT domain-containing protein n=1 Tax=Panagrellus redivivus TaxID=6233 RepID=A0A7E4V0Y5_PANRE
MSDSSDSVEPVNSTAKPRIRTAEDLKLAKPHIHAILTQHPTKWKQQDVDILENNYKECGPILTRHLGGGKASNYDRVVFVFNGKDIKSPRVICKKCSKTFHGSGGHLTRHTDECDPKVSAIDARQTTLTKSLTKTITKNEQSALAEAFGKLALDGVLPFKKLESDAVRDFTRTIFNLGVRHEGVLNEDFKFPGRKSIASSSSKIADSRFEKLRLVIKKAIEMKAVSIAFDYGKSIEDWLAVICHFPSPDGKLHCFPIVFIDWDPSLTKEADEVWRVLLVELETYDITEFDTINISAITDQGGNVLNAARGFGISVVCLGHILHTIAERCTLLYKKNKLTKQANTVLNDAKVLMDQCELLTLHIRTYGIGIDLPFIPRKPCSTRWLTYVDLMKDVNRLMPQLKEAYAQDKDCFGIKTNEGRAILKNEERIKVLCTFYEIFTTSIVSIQADSYPTLQRVLPTFKGFEMTADRLIREKDPLGDKQGSEFDTLRQSLGHSLKAVVAWKELNFLTDVHYLATMLWPKYKSISKFPPHIRTEAEDKLVELAYEYKPTQSSPPPKKPKSMFDFSDDEEETAGSFNVRAAVMREISSYRAMNDKPDEKDLITWWIGQKKILPIMSQIAIKVLSIPATSASAERVFSKLKAVLTSHRRSLHPLTTSRLIQFSNIDSDLLL